MQSEKLVQTLIEQTRKIINQAEKLKSLDTPTLTWKNDPATWSMLECVEHLNLYGDFYLPQMDQKIKNSNTQHEPEFKSGMLGGYFAKMMLPKAKLNKMKTFKDKNPLNVKLDKAVIERFINQQIKLLNLLTQSKNVSLNKVRIETSIASFIKLKLGDTFQFYINHMIRHFNQIERIQLQMKAEFASLSL